MSLRIGVANSIACADVDIVLLLLFVVVRQVPEYISDYKRGFTYDKEKVYTACYVHVIHYTLYILCWCNLNTPQYTVIQST
jgi:hypothetical protein